LMLAQAEQLEQQVVAIGEAQQDNTSKLDFLVKSEASKTVLAIRQEIAFHKSHNDGSTLWQRELADMETRLQRAEDYKDCVVNGRLNCDAERIW
jgi:hypothetical protein